LWYKLDFILKLHNKQNSLNLYKLKLILGGSIMDNILEKDDFKYDLKYKWLIKDNVVNTIIQDFPPACKMYSYNHYKMLQSALKMHLTLLSKDEQVAYINCKKLDYRYLDDISCLDFLIGIFTGGLGSIIYENAKNNNDIITIIAFVASAIGLYGLKIYLFSNRKYKFYLQLLDSLILE
jgi:hypothetical protein